MVLCRIVGSIICTVDFKYSIVTGNNSVKTGTRRTLIWNLFVKRVPTVTYHGLSIRMLEIFIKLFKYIHFPN